MSQPDTNNSYATPSKWWSRFASVAAILTLLNIGIYFIFIEGPSLLFSEPESGWVALILFPLIWWVLLAYILISTVLIALCLAKGHTSISGKRLSIVTLVIFVISTVYFANSIYKFNQPSEAALQERVAKTVSGERAIQLIKECKVREVSALTEPPSLKLKDGGELYVDLAWDNLQEVREAVRSTPSNCGVTFTG